MILQKLRNNLHVFAEKLDFIYEKYVEIIIYSFDDGIFIF